MGLLGTLIWLRELVGSVRCAKKLIKLYISIIILLSRMFVVYLRFGLGFTILNFKRVAKEAIFTPSEHVILITSSFFLKGLPAPEI